MKIYLFFQIEENIIDEKNLSSGIFIMISFLWFHFSFQKIGHKKLVEKFVSCLQVHEKNPRIFKINRYNIDRNIWINWEANKMEYYYKDYLT